MTLVNWIQAAIDLALLVALFVPRIWIKASIERRVQHQFDEKIESVRTELRKSEELFKGDLRAKETELSALRDGVLSGRAQRQALLDKRRLDAVERIWAAVIALAPYKTVSAFMARINFSAAAKRAPHEPNLRKFFEIIGSNIPTDALFGRAENEQPFVSPLAWAYFSAYRAILVSAYAQAKILEHGFEKSEKLFGLYNNLLKATLPHRSEFIDKCGNNAYDYLLDELEENLLVELKKMLEGQDIDQTSLARSAEIMDQVKKVTAEREREKIGRSCGC